MKKPITYVFHIYQNRESGEFLAFRHKELGYNYAIPEVIKQHGEPFHRLYAKIQAPTRELAIHMYCVDEGLPIPEPEWLK